MEFHKPTKELLDEICHEQGLDPFKDFHERREKIVAMALDRLGFIAEARAMTAIGRPKKGELSREETLRMMESSNNPALRFLNSVVRPTHTPNSVNQHWLFRLVQRKMINGLTPNQAAWKLDKELKDFKYRDILRAYKRESEKLKKD